MHGCELERATGPARRVGLAALMLVAALMTGAWPALGQEQASPAPTATAVTRVDTSQRTDLYLQMPYSMGGFEPDIVMTRGEEHFAGLPVDDPTRQELEQLLKTVGADPGDMVSGYALVSQEDFFSFVVALRVEGVEPGALLPAYLPILVDDLEDPETVAGEVGGRDVLIVTSLGDGDEYVELYVYDEGDTIWMVQGPLDVVETTLASLPDPLLAG
jgi:hypothetical protein